MKILIQCIDGISFDAETDLDFIEFVKDIIKKDFYISCGKICINKNHIICISKEPE